MFSFLKSYIKVFSKEKERVKSFDIMAKSKGLFSPGGLCVVASVGGGQSERPNFFNDKTVEFEEILKPIITFKKCGHRGSTKSRFNLWGNISVIKTNDTLATKKNGKIIAEGVCQKCFFEEIKQSAIRCCLCGCAILPGDGVALYGKKSKGIKKSAATFVENSAIGCLSWDCCPSGGFFAGHWTFEGFRSAFPDEKTIVDKSLSKKEKIVGSV